MAERPNRSGVIYAGSRDGVDKLAEKLGVAPANMLVLEDSFAGTKAGVAAGTYVVSIPHEHTCEHDFTGAKHCATSLVDPCILKLL